MNDRETYLNYLRVAEHQFRLACTVHLAVTNKVQTLDVPVEWSFGRHRVSYDDFGLRWDQADYAAALMEMTATLVIANAIRNALVALISNPRDCEDKNVVAAYQISRLIRNAFAHDMIRPKWSIDSDCAGKVFEIENVIKLDTTDLHGRYLEWRHYGGPLAIFYFGRFVRTELLKDPVDPNREKPARPTLECYQQGRMILRRVDEVPEGAAVATIEPGQRLHLGDGHYLEGAPQS